MCSCSLRSPIDVGVTRVQSATSDPDLTETRDAVAPARGPSLSDTGAALWLAGIPSWARAEVTYWTTQNSGGACNFLTSLFLDSPNDGVVERAKGQLPGGTNAGHVVGWCHTTGMSNPANYLDSVRNVERDAAAAR